jgi:hypothetical protein
MLIHFDSDVGEFTMAGDAAVQLIKMTGHSGTVPSALLAADIPAAVARLREAVDNAPLPPPPTDDAEEREYVPLKRRAFPLIDLLERAAKAGADVMWDRA